MAQPNRYYLHHRGRTNPISEATKEECQTIIDIFADKKSETIKTIFDVYQWEKCGIDRVKEQYQTASSDPTATHQKIDIMKKYFLPFDGPKARKFEDWKNKKTDWKDWNGDKINTIMSSFTPARNSRRQSSNDADEIDMDANLAANPVFNNMLTNDLSQSQESEEKHDDDEDDDLIDTTTGHNNNSNHNNSNRNTTINNNNNSARVGTGFNFRNEDRSQAAQPQNLQEAQSGLIQNELDLDPATKKALAGAFFLQIAPNYLDKLAAVARDYGWAAVQQAVLTTGNEFIKYLVFNDLGFDSPYKEVLQRLWPGTNGAVFDALINGLATGVKKWLIDRKFMNENGDQTGEFKMRLTDNNGICLNLNSLRAARPLGAPPEAQRLRLNEAGNSINTSSNQNRSPLPSNQSVPSNPSQNQNTQNSLMEVLSAQFNHGAPIRNFQDLTRITQSPQFTEFSNQQRILQNTFLPTGSTSTQIPNFQQQIDHLYQMLRNVTDRNQPPPSNLTSNPHHPNIILSFHKPYRGLDAMTVDVVQKDAIVDRARNIIIGDSMSTDLRNVLRSMNTDTNRELRNKLEGTLSFYIHLGIRSGSSPPRRSFVQECAFLRTSNYSFP